MKESLNTVTTFIDIFARWKSDEPEHSVYDCLSFISVKLSSLLSPISVLLRPNLNGLNHTLFKILLLLIDSYIRDLLSIHSFLKRLNISTVKLLLIYFQLNLKQLTTKFFI